MIPYKFYDLTARDQTGVLLSNIHRKNSKTQNAADIDFTLFTVPAENGFLLTSWSIEVSGAVGASYGNRAEVNLLDAQGNELSSMTQSFYNNVQIGTFPFDINAAVTIVGSPIAVIGPGIQIQMRGRFTVANAANRLEASLNGVLIPRGTMAFQS